MAKNLHIITGTTRGLGEALAQYLLQQGDTVIGLNRRKGSLSFPLYHDFQIDLEEDISTPQIFEKIFTEFPYEKFDRITLVNNAGIIDPISPVAELSSKEILKNIKINLNSPIILTAQFLKELELFSGEVVIVNVSSGVAQRPKGSWSVYSASKAGLEAFTTALNKEIENTTNISAYTFEPGIIDTNMQKTIRSTPESKFPDLNRFKKFKDDGALLAPEKVGSSLGKFLRKEVSLQEKQHFSITELLQAVELT